MGIATAMGSAPFITDRYVKNEMVLKQTAALNTGGLIVGGD